MPVEWGSASHEGAEARVPGRCLERCMKRCIGGAQAVHRRCTGGAQAVHGRCMGGAEAVRGFTCHALVTSTPLIAAPRAACAQVLPPGTRPLVSLARSILGGSILGGQLDARLLGSSGGGAT